MHAQKVGSNKKIMKIGVAILIVIIQIHRINGQTHNSRSTSYINSVGLVSSSFIQI
ncbi:MAG TPA: hypothetical protein VE089_07055 [Nitrososphaeraceae archaeon]|nr:hypothetical protein [Nitrososphaeraceae archaeon]